jgi:IclR family transcriptional regulator, pca regulon regulatory protein
MAQDRPAEFVEALAKGLAVLESFDAAHPEMTLSEIARRVGQSPAATRRALITLTELGYVGQTDKRFHLKPRVMALGSAFYFSARIDDVLQPALRALVAQFGDASSVGTLDGGEVIYVAHVSVQRARRAAAVVGARYPAHATSMGRVLLAAQDDATLEHWITTRPLTALTSRTLTDASALRAELARVREQGFATTVDQLDYGITALAVPIRNSDGRVVAALNTSGYTGMVSPDSLVTERLPTLRQVAAEIATELNRYPVLQSALGY